MIRLDISVGHSWSVWETEGGLQPTLASLNLPAEQVAKLEAWSKRCTRELWHPTYTGRKAFDAEGRALAIDLQRAIGETIHIRFRSWVAFDSRRWRTLWRDEDLVTGESEDNWFDDYLPDDLAIRVVQIYPDFAGAYLWDLNSCCISNESLPYSDDLDARFTAWAELWDQAYNFTAHKADHWQLSRIGFDQQGLDLAKELKSAVGNTHRVIYDCTLRELALDVLEDGGTVELPRNTDFRQWSLDQRNKGEEVT
jgi:hypothetical protein